MQHGFTFFLGLRDNLKDVVMETECQLALALHQALPHSLGLRIKTFRVPLVNVTTPLHLERASEAHSGQEETIIIIISKHNVIPPELPQCPQEIAIVLLG